MSITRESFTRVNNDVNGNPRYVLHYLHINESYEDAIKASKVLGGKRYHTKAFGGGIVFTTYELSELIHQIKDRVTGNLYYRDPTMAEIKFGEGATHFKSFLAVDCRKIKRGCLAIGELKKWVTCKHDGLRYYLW